MKGKSVLITGGGSGIGRAAAIAFAGEGAAVVVVDRSFDTAQETAELVVSLGGQATALHCDVSDPSQVETMFAAAVGAYDGIDFAFNNAGVSQIAAETGDIPIDEWQTILSVNVSGVFYCMREELKHMTARGTGAIVNTSSLAGLRTIKSQSAYTASKHAVSGLTKNAAVEYAARGIRINAICPGGVATAMFEQMLDATGLNSEQRALARRGLDELHPMMRAGEASEIADAVVYLCSDRATFITGVCMPVDGGWAAN